MVATRQLKALGYNRASAARAANVGRLKRLHRGVYAVGHEKLTWKGNCMAAVLANGPAVASHWTAAWLWGLIGRETSRFHLTAPSRRHRRPPFIVHFARLRTKDMGEIDAIPVTSLERTHLDIAAIEPERLAGFLERSEDHQQFDLHKFEALLRRSAHHPGYTALDRALRIYRPDPAFTRSKLEKRFRALLRDASLPLPGQNVILGPYELDCYWPEHRFCVELDTYGTHGSRRSFEEDRKRQRVLRREYGVEVERVTDVQLEREADEVLADVAASLERRRRERD